jgi:hypothetical protein
VLNIALYILSEGTVVPNETLVTFIADVGLYAASSTV